MIWQQHTMLLSLDNVSIKYAHFQRFRHAISTVFTEKAADYEKMCSTKASDDGTLIESCAKGTSRGYVHRHPLFPKLQQI